MTGTWLFWLGWTTALAACLGSVYWAWRALFHDRSRGRRRCPRCWYDLDYSPGMTCGECGFTARRETQLFQTRRRYGRAAMAITVCVAVVVSANHYAMEFGWLSFVPTRVVIAALPLGGGDANGELWSEIHRRIRRGEVSDGHWDLIVERVAIGDFRARPGSDAWRTGYGSIVRSWRAMLAGERGDDGAYTEREQLWLDLPPDVQVRSRTSWPRGVDPVAQVKVDDWWPAGTEARLSITPDLPGAETTTFVRGALRPVWSDFPLPPLEIDDDVDRVTFTVDVERRRAGVDADEPWTDVGTFTTDLAIRRVGTLEEMIEPITGDPLDDAIADTFRGGVAKWTSGPVPVRVYYRGQRTSTSLFDDVAIGVHVDLMRDGEIMRRLTMWWLGGASVDDRRIGYASSMENEDAIRGINADDGRWTMRVTGDPAVALRAGDAKRYWSGEIEVPLVINTINREAPPLRWQTEEDEDDPGDGRETSGGM